MSFLVEQAGGASTDGHQRILDIQPDGLHQRVAVFLGSKEEVARAGLPQGINHERAWQPLLEWWFGQPNHRADIG
jgi:hypothetical protein